MEQSVKDGMISRIKEILSGIDQEDSETEDGWWETSTGADFGARKLKEIEEFISSL